MFTRVTHALPLRASCQQIITLMVAVAEVEEEALKRDKEGEVVRKYKG
jgi:hypothetical protein